jgi:hypothetical protein
MLLILSLPILIETETILNLWHTFVPENTITFLRLILLTTWINSIANPLIVSVKATGKVKRYESIIGVIMLLILPISYIFLKLGYPPYIVFVVHLCMECVAQIARIFITHNLIGFSVFSFLKSVIFRILSVVTVALVIPLCLFIYLDDSILSFLSVCFSSVVSCILSIYLLGLTNNERTMIVNKAKGKTSCSCGCGGCAMKDMCHSRDKSQNTEGEGANENRELNAPTSQGDEIKD